MKRLALLSLLPLAACGGETGSQRSVSPVPIPAHPEPVSLPTPERVPSPSPTPIDRPTPPPRPDPKPRATPRPTPRFSDRVERLEPSVYRLTLEGEDHTIVFEVEHFEGRDPLPAWYGVDSEGQSSANGGMTQGTIGGERLVGRPLCGQTSFYHVELKVETFEPVTTGALSAFGTTYPSCQVRRVERTFTARPR